MKLGPYKGLRAKKPVISVREQEVTDILKQKQMEHCVVYDASDRAAAAGDQVIIDFDGTVNGTPIPQGKARDFVLVLGSHSFIRGFEEQIAGRRVGENFDICVTFPENYFMKNLRRKRGVFYTTLKRVCVPEYQALDDDFAKDFSEYQTLSEWKTAIQKQLIESRKEDATEKLSQDIMEKIIETSEIPVNEELKDELTDDIYENFREKLRERGLSPTDYYQRTGLKEAELHRRQEARAVRAIQEHSILYAISEREHIPVEQVLPFLLEQTVYE